MAYVFDPTVHRYRDDGGKVVPISIVRQVIENVVDAAKVELSDLALAFTSGQITADQWHERAKQIIEYYHNTAAALARGGYDQMGDEDRKLVADKIASEEQYLERFVKETEERVAKGDVPSRQGIINRSQMYGDAAWGTAMDMERTVMQRRGYDLERRVLFRGSGDGATCDDCRELAQRGWVPIGTLPVPGDDTACFRNCRCTFTYAKSAQVRS